MNKRYKLPQHLIKRNWAAIRIGLNGWRFAWRNETSVRQWFVIAVLLTPVAIWLGDGLETILMLMALWAIMVIELINTAIETTLDRITFDDDETIKRAKDVASSAVFATVLIAAFVWGYCLFFH